MTVNHTSQIKVKYTLQKNTKPGIQRHDFFFFIICKYLLLVFESITFESRYMYTNLFTARTNN